jgi:hypothetical protein
MTNEQGTDKDNFRRGRRRFFRPRKEGEPEPAAAGEMPEVTPATPSEAPESRPAAAGAGRERNRSRDRNRSGERNRDKERSRGGAQAETSEMRSRRARRRSTRSRTRPQDESRPVTETVTNYVAPSSVYVYTHVSRPDTGGTYDFRPEHFSQVGRRLEDYTVDLVKIFPPTEDGSLPKLASLPKPDYNWNEWAEELATPEDIQEYSKRGRDD